MHHFPDGYKPSPQVDICVNMQRKYALSLTPDPPSTGALGETTRSDGYKPSPQVDICVNMQRKYALSLTPDPRSAIHGSAGRNYQVGRL